jgi:hypothetical protein
MPYPYWHRRSHRSGKTFKIHSSDKMSFKERLGAAVSAIWVSIVYAFAANEAASAEVFDLRAFFADSVLLGLLPVFMGWGLYSILRAEKR